MYTVDGARRLPESVLDHLPGYEESRPVRIGNAAVDQRQMDVLGEVMVALDAGRRAGLSADEDAWRLQPSSSTTSPRTGSSPTTASGRSAARAGTSRTRG